jgi:hypothetical protein
MIGPSLIADLFDQVGFKIFLNVAPTVTNWTSDNNQFSLIFDDNPLADFVELPDDGRAQDELWFSNILCGVLRGALEMVSRLLSGRLARLDYDPPAPSPLPRSTLLCAGSDL